MESKMTWEDTVLSGWEVLAVQVGSMTCDDNTKSLIEAQTKKTWDAAYKEGQRNSCINYEIGLDAGRREVVEWIQSHQLIEPSPDSITRFAPFYHIEQAKLKK